jgi:hypothetical protein
MKIDNLTLLTTTPFERINDYIPIRSNELLDMLNSSKIPNMSIDNKRNDLDTRYQFLKLQEAFVYIPTETAFHYPSPFLTEKSFKGITAKRPFILVAACGCLQRIRDLGFKTFGEFWDESYDLDPNPETRLIKIVNLINNISSHSNRDLQNILIAMEPILEYNFNYYKNSFFKNELTKFERALDCLK